MIDVNIYTQLEDGNVDAGTIQRLTNLQLHAEILHPDTIRVRLYGESGRVSKEYQRRTCAARFSMHPKAENFRWIIIRAMARNEDNWGIR